MATTTPNLTLRKPAGVDFVNVDLDLNNNWVKIDNTFSVSSPTAHNTGDSNPNAGSLMIVAKADHRHPGEGFGTPVSIGTTNSSGAAATISRSDHVHSGVRKYVAMDTWWPLEKDNFEYGFFYLPDAVTSLKLSLFGTVGRSSGPLPSHTHTGTSTITFQDSGGQNVDHLHTITVDAAGGHAHTASGSSGNAGAHSHTVSGDTGSGTPHEHIMKVKSTAGGDPSLDSSATGANDNTNYIDTEAVHTHPLSASTSGVSDHAHTVAVTVDAVANHTHTASASGTNIGHIHNIFHEHTISVTSTGVGGYATYRWPQTVSVYVDGTDRTAALGGPWGSSQADWNLFDLNIQPYASSAGWHSIYVVTSAVNSGGRLRAYIRAEG